MLCVFLRWSLRFDWITTLIMFELKLLKSNSRSQVASLGCLNCASYIVTNYARVINVVLGCFKVDL